MTTKRTCHELGVCHGRPGVGCTCNQDARHDARQLPPGGFYFAPGAVEQQPRAGRVPRWLVLLVEVALLLAIAASLGVASGWLHAKGLL